MIEAKTFEKNVWLCLHIPENYTLIEVQTGNEIVTPHPFELFESREKAVECILTHNPDWVDPSADPVQNLDFEHLNDPDFTDQ
jgi:hypothetical protein